MGFHSDDERELGPEPTIASLTFGATRTFVMKHKKDVDLPSSKIPLEAGTVLLMKGREVLVVTPQSPLGEALLGRKVGDQIEVNIQRVIKDMDVVAVS